VLRRLRCRGARRGYYERSGFLRRIEPGLIDASLAIMDEPHAAGEIVFWQHGGAVSRVKPDATAVWHRDAGQSLLVDSDWDDPHQRVRSTDGGNYPKLVKLKGKYDPTNLFRLNANVPPSMTG
jgi:Berberine and berberine like